jgi:hypothetical protein
LSRGKSQGRSPAKRKTKPAVTQPSAGADTSPGNSDPGLNAAFATRSRRLLNAAISIAVVWGAVLAGLPFTPKPITLNRVQIRQAELVVTGTISDPQQGTVVVEKEWKHGEKRERMTIVNLNRTGAKRDSTYLIPLSKTSGKQFQVTPTPLPNQAPLIYPATPESIALLEKLLK